MPVDLRERFFALWKQFGTLLEPDEIFEDLVIRYSEVHRFYHNLDHLRFGLLQLDLLKDLAVNLPCLEFAYFLHDSRYEIRSLTNEEDSARLAQDILTLAGLAGKSQVADVTRLIMVTKKHEPLSDIDEMIMVDIDLAILGQDPQTYVLYEHNVWREYVEVGGIDEERFWRGRKGILEGFLQRERIYNTDRFDALYTQQARENLRNSIRTH